MNSTLALRILPPQLRLSKGVAFLMGVATRHLSAGPAGNSRRVQHTSGPQAGHRQCVELFKKEHRTMPRFRLSLQRSWSTRSTRGCTRCCSSTAAVRRLQRQMTQCYQASITGNVLIFCCRRRAGAPVQLAAARGAAVQRRDPTCAPVRRQLRARHLRQQAPRQARRPRACQVHTFGEMTCTRCHLQANKHVPVRCVCARDVGSCKECCFSFSKANR